MQQPNPTEPRSFEKLTDEEWSRVVKAAKEHIDANAANPPPMPRTPEEEAMLRLA